MAICYHFSDQILYIQSYIAGHCHTYDMFQTICEGVNVSRYYLGVDQGTTMTTAVVMDENNIVCAKASRPVSIARPNCSWAEHAPQELLSSIADAAQESLAKAGVRPEDVRAMGLDHQGETCCVWETKTGTPVYPAIGWQDRRTAAQADLLKAERAEEIRTVTGLMPDAYYSATKLRWIIDHIPHGQERLDNGELRAGTMDVWFRYKMTDGNVFSTDMDSAGRTLLMDAREGVWCQELLSLFDFPRAMLPEIKDCNAVFGETRPAFLGEAPIVLAGSITDSNAGSIGSGCMDPGTLYASFGTGMFMSLYTGENFIVTDPALIASGIQLNGIRQYKLQSSAYTAGAAIQWLKNGLRIIDSPADTERMALSVPDSAGVLFVPAFSGLATPEWDAYARGAFFGLTAAASREHIVRAVLEGIALQSQGCYFALRNAYGPPTTRMRVGGGMVDNAFLMQFLADLLGIPVEIPQEKETAAFGAACLAQYSIGDIASLTDIQKTIRLAHVYEPRISEDERLSWHEQWKAAASRTLSWTRDQCHFLHLSH